MMKKLANQIVTPDDYDNMLKTLEQLMKKGEKNASEKELALIGKMAAMLEDYEDKKGIGPVYADKAKKTGNDPEKIKALLGYEPDLIELVEFKLYQMKIKQNALADLLDMTPSKVSQILNRKREPDIAFLKGIHEKLGIDGNYILEAV
ncbi:MAG: helix-turn-helix transcriptional regulator [Bacteroidetes bacterium]|nr:helix-turn-helix transcriptional regulator [Bacteroidota bacterium]